MTDTTTTTEPAPNELCFDCDRRIVKRGDKWETRIGNERTCAGREGRKGHRTIAAAIRAERAAAARS